MREPAGGGRVREREAGDVWWEGAVARGKGQGARGSGKVAVGQRGRGAEAGARWQGRHMGRHRGRSRIIHGAFRMT